MSAMGLVEIKDLVDEERVVECLHCLELPDGETIIYDLSKNHLTKKDVESFKKRLKEEVNLPTKIDEMWTGEPINFTEKRAVLHYLLRDTEILNSVSEAPKKEMDPLSSEESKKRSSQAPQSARNEIKAELKRVSEFCAQFPDLRGITGKAFRNIVNIGIGGSDLGPRMATRALRHYSRDYRVFFISNVDGDAALQVFSEIDPEETLFIVVSKTFTTVETISNFKLALSLFVDRMNCKNKRTQASDDGDHSHKTAVADGSITEEQVRGKKRMEERGAVADTHEICKKHFVAVSANIPEAKKYGIERIFAMWDYVGGRYSLWSPVGLSLALYVGFENYVSMLRGAAAADAEFYSKRMNSVAAEMAMVEAYYVQKGYTNKCVVAYDEHLELLYKYLQQAEMESNGKPGSPQMVIWGGVGTDVQHSFFQQLHQGSQMTHTEFLVPAESVHERKKNGMGAATECFCSETSQMTKALLAEHHEMLVANCLAQSRAFMIGRDAAESEPMKRFPGNRPSTTILYSSLTPAVLGAILAVYEHKIFVNGLVYGVNSFDQFGVQLGKDIATELNESLKAGKVRADPSTERLAQEVFRMRKGK